MRLRLITCPWADHPNIDAPLKLLGTIVGDQDNVRVLRSIGSGTIPGKDAIGKAPIVAEDVTGRDFGNSAIGIPGMYVKGHPVSSDDGLIGNGVDEGRVVLGSIVGK